jgi:uncharacterized lipoprotein YddW (UPF0748 family)
LGTDIVIARARLHLSAVLAAGVLLACGAPSDAPPSASPAQETAAPSGSDDPPGAVDPAGVPDALEVIDPLAAVRAHPAGVRGVWVLAEGSQRVLEDADRVERLVSDAQVLGVSDLFVQVYRGGRAWYDASLADRAPYEALLSANGLDTLSLLLDRAHAAGLRVHAWVNVLSLSTNRSAPILDAVGRDAVLVDRRGRSMLDYPDLEVPPPDRGWYRMGTRGVYLDPGAPGVSERLVAVFRELIERYPGLLPFVPGSRFGVGLDFGYGIASQRAFRAETGRAGPYRDPASPDPADLIETTAWDDWRRQQVTDLVAEIAEATRTARPGLVLSAAVNSYVDRAYLTLAQDWLRWLEEDLIDWAIPMAYTLDDRLLRYQLEQFAGLPLGERIVPGLGVWLFASRPQGAIDQIEIAHAAGARSDVLFSYDSIVDAPALRRALEAIALEMPQPVAGP